MEVLPEKAKTLAKPLHHGYKEEDRLGIVAEVKKKAKEQYL